MTHRFTRNERDEFIDSLAERYGDNFEKLERKWKLIFRAALADYLANLPFWKESAPGNITLMETCIEGAGVDAGIWDEEELAEAINDCEHLGESDIEMLIECLTNQLKATTRHV